MSERTVGTNTRKKLINNEPFAYAHLVKFERPSSTLTSGKYSTDAKRYAYFTDATHNISFDDQSYATDGTTSNGSQTYVAGKLLDIGTYSETVEARASGMTMTMAAESLNNAITSNAITMTSSTITVPAGIDLVKEGFREGDKVYISGGSNNTHYVNVTGIKTNNTVLTVSESLDAASGVNLSTQNAGTSITLSIVSDELQGPLGETNLSTVKSYANRDVWVYKAFLDPETGTVLDSTPVLIFKGIITKTSIVEVPGGSVKAKWSLTSHWGDFAQVNGRPTNDAVHRALDNQNRGQRLVAKREEYANDLGFLHAEETLNILATYTSIEQETKYKMKKKWYGKVKMKEITTDVEVENDVDLNFSLASKFLPVVYGVQRVAAIPFFVDTKENDPNNIFLAYALCEGEIGGIYDLYMEGNPLMCINKEDADDRDASSGSQLEEIEVHCRGRADLGNTLGGVKLSGSGVSGSSAENYTYGDSYAGYGGSGFNFERDFIGPMAARYYEVNAALKNTTVSTTDGTGVQDRETISLTAPNTMSLTFHAGSIDQKADDLLVEISQASSGQKFKRQADYYTGDEDYWGPNHRVLDTAYVVMDCEIGEDATTVPEVEYVVRGKLCSSYNYDYSYAHSGSGEDNTHFNVGDKVVLHSSSTVTAGNFVVGNSYSIVSAGNTSFTGIGAANNNVHTTFTATGAGSGTGTADLIINSSVLIIDKWSFADPDGNIQYRFRYSTAPSLGYSDGYATIKEFYMKNSSNQVWTMGTWDYTPTTTYQTVPETQSVSATVNNNGTSPATITIPADLEWIADIFSGDTEFEDYYSVAIANSNLPYGYNPLWWVLTNSTTLTQAGSGGNSTGITAGSQTVISKTTIKLASGASSTDDAYNDFDIELVKTSTAEDGSTQTQSWTRTITDYDGGTKVATINTPWEDTFEPLQNDKYALKSKIKNGRTDDKRVSINPTIQLLDYLTGRYGKELKLDTDISLADFLLAARTCDDRGTQTLQGAQAGSVGDRYVLTSDGTASGTVVSMGLVKAVGTSNSIGYTEFEQVYGKFTKKFMKNSYSYLVGDIIYTDAGYYRVTSAGTKATKPTGTNPTGFTGPLTSFPVFAINNSTGAITSTTSSFTRSTNSIYYNPCAVYNSSTEGYDTGYSLYDSDHVKYWRYYGWDDKHQRFATRHQTQGTVSTADSVFENVNGFLRQFNGLLSYEGGKYALRIETTSDTITSTKITAANTGSYSGYTKGVEHNPRVIDDDDIIGNITLDDKGTAKSYNTVSASIMDPANLFKGRAVTFYDSNYLRADKNVVKSGNINISSVANYYNARINVENFLRKSRFGLSISFKIGPKSLMLLAGDTISITNSKFGFTEKYFRITNINYAKDCTATITATEYDASFYSISSPTLPSVKSEDQRQGLQAGPSAPSSLSATANSLGGVDLAWTNGSGLKAANCWTQIYSSPDSNVNNRTLLATVPFPGTTFAHSLGAKDLARYYWIRAAKQVVLTSGGQNKVKELYSAYVGPANATTTAPISAYGVKLGGATAFNVASNGTATPTSIVINASRTNLSGNITWSAVEEDSGSITLTSTGNTAATLTYANFGASNKYVTITASVTSTTAERDAGADNTYTDTWVISKVDQGVDGDDGAAGAVGLRTANGYLYYNTLQASAPGAPSNSSVSYAFATGLLSGGVIGTGGSDWNQNAPAATGGTSGSKMWYVYWTTTEASAGGGTGTTVTLGSTVYNATNFVGLVRFSGTNTLVDGAGTSTTALVAADVGSSGSTTIDGGRVTTGTIAAARISTDLLRINGTNFTGEHQGGEVGGWTLASDAIYSGTKDTTG